jgi:glycosyltransferase involved in cell wall biosynthesis
MRVAFDEQIFLLQNQGGVSRYFVELLRGLPRVDPRTTVVTPFRRIVNRHALEAFPDRFSGARGPLQPYPQLVGSLARPRRGDRVDLIHHTFYHPRFLRDYPGTPKAVTIYDMIPELVGAKGRFGPPHMAKQEYVRRADLLLFISQSAHDDLVSVYGQPTAPCRVTHLGVDRKYFAGGARPPGFPTDYLLFVGKRDGYKDFASMLSAFADLRPSAERLDLVCVGGGTLTVEEREQIRRLDLTGLVHQASLPDSEMAGAYASALAFAFTSRYEGFGLPALEAMAAGTPAILANTSSLPEVGGEAALYFQPGDRDGLAAALSLVLTDSRRRQELIDAGRTRAAGFSWSATARRTTEAYASVLA